MSFVSLSFIAFLIVTVILYFIVPKKFQSVVLLLCSIGFYFTFSKRAFAFLVLSTVIAYLGAKFLDKCENTAGRKCILLFSIGFNVLLLIILKYCYSWTSRVGLVVPIGISFYTLSIVGYVIDVYRKKYAPENNFLDFLLYVSFFPHILQGPIARYDQLGAQLKAEHSFDYERVTRGCQLMMWGYIKKMIVADRAAVFVDAVYGQYVSVGGTVLFVASLLYTIQIYADFSGCVDIAMGVSEIFGIELIQNFKQPYLAGSINDFWKRWHISLSSWFRDYLYIPLGGNRKGIVRRWLNVLIVFTVSGFWHGVGVNYIIWGLLHGLYQVIGYVLMPIRKQASEFMHLDTETAGIKTVHIIITFLLVNFAWIFFRVTDMRSIFEILKAIFTDISPWILTDGTLYTFGVSEKAFHVLMVFILLMFLVDILHDRKVSIRAWISRECLAIRWMIYFGAIFAVTIWGIYGIGYNASSFIYMNF